METLDALQPAQQEPRADVVREVRHDPDPGVAEGRDVEGERVALDDVQPIGIPCRELAECSHATAILLHCDDMGRAGCKQRPGQPARSRPHLQYDSRCARPGCVRDLAAESGVEEEVLPERAFRLQVMPRDDGRERR